MANQGIHHIQERTGVAAGTDWRSYSSDDDGYHMSQGYSMSHFCDHVVPAHVSVRPGHLPW
eukprot:1160176-Pelagomonas_calceolata.AAC.12